MKKIGLLALAAMFAGSAFAQNTQKTTEPASKNKSEAQAARKRKKAVKKVALARPIPTKPACRNEVKTVSARK